MTAIYFVPIHTAGRAQTAAILSAKRIERERKDERVPNRRLEIHLIRFDPINVFLPRCLTRVKEDVVQVNLHVRREPREASAAIQDDVPGHRPRHMDPVDQSFKSQVEMEGSVLGDPGQRDRDPFQDMVDLELFRRAGTTQQLRDVYGEQRGVAHSDQSTLSHPADTISQHMKTRSEQAKRPLRGL
jgi:hypothetical protein